MPKVIKIKYFDDELERIQKVKVGDWYDLRSAETVDMKIGEFRLIPLGVAMQLPDGYEAHVVPRSSTFKKYGIIQTNGAGIIDNSYCGDNDQWFFPALKLMHNYGGDDHTLQISKGDRICQFRIVEKQPDLEFVEVKTLGNPDRGGHGSTGIQ